MVPYPVWALAAAAIWGVIAWGIAFVQTRLARDEHASPRLVALLTQCFVLWFVGVALVPFAAPLIAGRPPDSATQHVVACSLAAALAGFAMFRSLRNRHLAACDMRSNRARASSRGHALLGGVGSVLILVSIGNWLSLTAAIRIRQGDSLLAVGAFFALGLSMAIGQRRLAGVGAKGATIPLEDSPLAEELRAIAAHFGQDSSKLKVQTTRTDRSSAEDMTPEQVGVVMRTWVFHRRRPWIPIELIQRVEPREVTAAVAYRYALASPIRGRGFPLKMLALAAIAVLLAMGVGALNMALAPILKGAVPIVMMAITGGIFGVVLVWVPRRLGLVRTPEQGFLSAYEAWRDAAPDEDRCFVDYTLALLASDRLTLMLGPEADLVPLVHKNQPLVRAASKAQGLPQAEFLSALRNRLSASPAPYPDSVR